VTVPVLFDTNSINQTVAQLGFADTADATSIGEMPSFVIVEYVNEVIVHADIKPIGRQQRLCDMQRLSTISSKPFAG